MSEEIMLTVNGQQTTISSRSTVAVAVMLAGAAARTSVTGESRGVLCGMGICFECRVTINGRPHCRSCQMLCQAGMEVTTLA
jgi:aerobic-type carbon monoxide dehydrogenase small subunit (CoxS/CutS family)